MSTLSSCPLSKTADLWETAVSVDPSSVVGLVLEARVGDNLIRSPKLLPGHKMNVGRATETGMSVHYDRQMSRSHFSIECCGDYAIVCDLQSTNGTFVQGGCVDQSRVYDGDQIAAGNTRFTVRLVRQ